MNVFVVNAGSSSLKFQVIATDLDRIKQDNDQLLCYSKEEGDNLILVAVNLDPRNTQSGWLDFDRAPGESYGLEDLVAAGHYTWSGRRNFVQLNPHTLPAHVFRVTRK